jgi:glycosyltransferase involved in cell wall biosynthesis
MPSVDVRILIVNRALGVLFGGGESFDLGAARELVRRGHQVTLLTARSQQSILNPTDHPDLRVATVVAPNIRRLAYRVQRRWQRLSAALYHLDNLVFELGAFGWILKHSLATRFDVIQCCALFRLPDWILRRQGTPCVSWLPGPPSRWASRKVERLVHQSRFALFVRGATIEHLERRMNLMRDRDFSIIEPGIDLILADGARKSWLPESIPSGAFLGVTVSRLVPVKDLSVLISAVKLAAAKVDLHWVLIGDGPDQATLRGLATSLGIDDRIHFVGHQPPESVHAYLCIADLFALTSLYESFSIAALEAMAHEVPVIVSAGGYLPELINRSEAGVVVESRDPEAFAVSMINLLGDPKLRQRLGQKGRAFAESHSWPSIAAKLETVYHRVSGPTKPVETA